MNIMSWNVAGLRARIKKNDMDFLKKESIDIVCLQETKCTTEQLVLPEWIKEMYPYRAFASCDGTSQRKGLNGVCIWSKIKPIKVMEPMEVGRSEGRIVTMRFPGFVVVSVYTPNSQEPKCPRARFRELEWDPAFREYISSVAAKSPVIVCGDFNVAITDMDVEYPEEWAGTAGLLPAERDNFAALLELGLVDTFRHQNPDEGWWYTYWNMRCPWERKANIGWRIDYILTSASLLECAQYASIRDDIHGSDHCPVMLEITMPKRRRLRIVKRNLG